MGLGSQMKNLSEELLSSFKERIKANEDLVSEVQKTLENFRKDHQEMADVINANAAALRKGLAKGEKERLNTYKGMMNGIHNTITSIQKEVVDIQNSTLSMIHDFTTDRAKMAGELNKFFAKGQADRRHNEKTRMKDFDAMMKNINDDISSINDEVAAIFKNTNDMLERFEKEHKDMSEELRAELSKNLNERVDYTRNLLNGFQKKLSEISKENQKMAQKLRKDLDKGEAERMSDYAEIMKGINVSIKGIRTEVKGIRNSTAAMLDDLLLNRNQAASEWSKMQSAMAQIRKTGTVKAPKETAKKAEKPEVKKVAVPEPVKEKIAEPAPAKAEKKIVVREESIIPPAPQEPMALKEKVLDFIKKHPKGVKISAMEQPLGETRMKLGFVAKNLLDEGKVLKIENVYYPKPKLNK